MSLSPAKPTVRPGRTLHVSGLLVVAVVAAIVVVGAAAYGGWYLFLRPAGPAGINLGGLQLPASSAVGNLDGTWTVDPSIGSGATGSFVGYRVQEQLASIGANTAVGRTSAVSGTFTLQGTSVTAATITADLTGLTSDDPRRDLQLSVQGLETTTYPTATFVLGQPIDLGSLPPDGQVVTTTATGQLTLHGQTRTVRIVLQAKRSGGVIAIAGSLPIAFADFGIQPPSSFAVLSVAGNSTMEFQLLFTHS
jgi:polyisoprenoid-binding protein YceI